MTDELMTAAYAYVDSEVSTADARLNGFPMWYGWALRQAFIAGAKHADEARVNPYCDSPATDEN